MLAAHLRGLLKPTNDYGIQSALFEDVILEALVADISADNFKLRILADSALAAILTDDSKRNAMRRIERQTRRQAALRLMDVYGLAGGRRRASFDGAGRISLLQLFQLMRNEGIITPDEAAATTDT